MEDVGGDGNGSSQNKLPMRAAEEVKDGNRK